MQCSEPVSLPLVRVLDDALVRAVGWFCSNAVGGGLALALVTMRRWRETRQSAAKVA